MRGTNGWGLGKCVAAVAIATSLWLLDPSVASAQDETYWSDGSPMTLFQWSSGNSYGGGASLDEPLASDRPDFTEASTTVGRGVVQLEMGYTYVEDRDG